MTSPTIEFLRKYRDSLNYSYCDPVDQLEIDDRLTDINQNLDWICEALAMQSGDEETEHNYWTARKINQLKDIQKLIGQTFGDDISERYRQNAQLKRDNEPDEPPSY